MKKEKIGFVSNYFSKISVATVEITDKTFSVGDTLHFFVSIQLVIRAVMSPFSSLFIVRTSR